MKKNFFIFIIFIIISMISCKKEYTCTCKIIDEGRVIDTHIETVEGKDEKEKCDNNDYILSSTESIECSAN